MPLWQILSSASKQIWEKNAMIRKERFRKRRRRIVNQTKLRKQDIQIVKSKVCMKSFSKSWLVNLARATCWIINSRRCKLNTWTSQHLDHLLIRSDWWIAYTIIHLYDSAQNSNNWFSNDKLNSETYTKIVKYANMDLWNDK